MKREHEIIRSLFAKLIRAAAGKFPEAGRKIEAPSRQGVYVIYGPKGRALHVGRTPKARGGIAQRLRNHLHAASSFTIAHLHGHGAKLRRGYKSAVWS